MVDDPWARVRGGRAIVLVAAPLLALFAGFVLTSDRTTTAGYRCGSVLDPRPQSQVVDRVECVALMSSMQTTATLLIGLAAVAVMLLLVLPSAPPRRRVAADRGDDRGEGSGDPADDAVERT